MNTIQKYDNDIDVERKENEYLCSGYLREEAGRLLPQISEDILSYIMCLTK